MVKQVSVVYCGGRCEPHKLVVWSSLTSLECCTPANEEHATQWTEGDVYCYKRMHVSGCKLEKKRMCCGGDGNGSSIPRTRQST